jgi:hypothetical protein
VVGLLPTLLAVGAITFLVAADAPAQPFTWNRAETAAERIGTSGAVFITAVSIALAISLQPLQFRLVQLLEGYWPAWVPLLVARVGIASETRRRDRIIKRISMPSALSSGPAQTAAEEKSQTAEIQVRERFPSEDRLLPTALGNALRASEDRVGQRYGLESVIIWPRLFRVLPREFQEALDDEVTQLDVSARLTVTWSIAAAVGSVVVLRDPHALAEHPAWGAIVACVWLLARLSYSSAVESALAHGSDVEVAIDLYRDRVVEAMRLPPTRKLSQDRRVFAQLCRLFQTHGPSSQELHFRTDTAA